MANHTNNMISERAVAMYAAGIYGVRDIAESLSLTEQQVMEILRREGVIH